MLVYSADQSLMPSWCIVYRTAMLVALGGRVRLSCVGAVLMLLMTMVAATKEKHRYARPKTSMRSPASGCNGTCTSNGFSCQPGLRHSETTRRLSTHGLGWACTVNDVLWYKSIPRC